MVADGYKDTEIGVIPDEWEAVELGDIATFSKGKGISKNEIIEDGIPCMRYAEIYTEYDTVLKHIKSFIDEKSALNSKKINQGDILFAGSGETLDDIGKSVAFIDDFEAYVGGDTVILSPAIDYNSLFMAYQLNSTLVRLQLRKLGQGSSVVHIYSSGLEKVKVPFPSLKEQEKIADILSTADEKIDAIATQIEKTKTLKKGLLQKLLSEGIGHSEFKDSELGKIPASWEVVELDNVAKLNKQKYTPIQSESINYIGLEHINQEQGTIKGVGNSNDTLSQKNCFNKGEILFGKLRPYLRKFYLAEIDGVCSTEILVIKAKENILNSILFQIVKTETFIEHSVSKVFGTKMPRTSWAILQEFRLALPPLKEQKQIADILSTADEKLAVLRAKKEKYETLKKGLLQKLLSGEVRV